MRKEIRDLEIMFIKSLGYDGDGKELNEEARNDFKKNILPEIIRGWSK